VDPRQPQVACFPSRAELWNRYRAWQGLDATAENVARFPFHDDGSGKEPRYCVLVVLQSPKVREFFTGSTRPLAHPTLDVGQSPEKSIPLPPLAEQHRIVAKVDALMALIDQLEAGLTAAVDLHAQFAAAAVHHLDA
jgi:type I restriction enzyme S subunit